MRTRLLIIGWGIVLSGCRSKNKVALHGLPVTNPKDIQQIAGTWNATAATYALLEKKKYAPDTVYVILHPDSAFEVRLPDCLDAAGKGGQVWDAIGAWRLYQDEGAWKLGMAFERGRLFRHRTYTHFDLVVKDSVLTLARYIGNPDKEEVLEFRKQP